QATGSETGPRIEILAGKLGLTLLVNATGARGPRTASSPIPAPSPAHRAPRRLLRVGAPRDDRTVETHHFFDRVRDQVGIATNRLPGRTILEQAAKAVCHELRRRLVPREQHLQHDADRLLAGERVAVGLASLRENADEIVAWAFGSGLHQGRGVAPEGRQLARRLDLLFLAGTPVDHRAAVARASLD